MRTIKKSRKLWSLLGGCVCGIIMGALVYIFSELDYVWNPQIIEALRAHMEWYQYLTAHRHAITVVVLDHPVVAPVILGAIMGLALSFYFYFSGED